MTNRHTARVVPPRTRFDHRRTGHPGAARRNPARVRLPRRTRRIGTRRRRGSCARRRPRFVTRARPGRGHLRRANDGRRDPARGVPDVSHHDPDPGHHRRSGGRDRHLPGRSSSGRRVTGPRIDGAVRHRDRGHRPLPGNQPVNTHPSPTVNRAHGSNGSATIWMIGVVVSSMLMIGLVLDGGTMLRARSDAFSLAAAAARAGAQQLDPDAAAQGRPVLDPNKARQVAIDYLTGHDATGTVALTGSTITVTVSTTAHLQLLQVVGARTVQFNATATVRAVEGPAMTHRVFRGVAALVALGLILGAVPYGLARWGSWPITGIPTGQQLRDLPTAVLTDTTVFAVLTVTAWIVWALFAVSVLFEISAVARGVEAPRLPASRTLQHGARHLVAALLMSVAAYRPLPAHAAGTLPARLASAQSSAVVVDAPPSTGPTVATSTVAPVPVIPPAAAVGQSPPSTTGAAVITVRPGDNAWQLATTYLGDGMRWREIWDLNHDQPQPDGTQWTDPQLILPGWQLTLPASAAAPPPTSAPAPAPAAPRTTHHRRHRSELHRDARRHADEHRHATTCRPRPDRRAVRTQSRSTATRRRHPHRSQPHPPGMGARTARLPHPTRTTTRRTELDVEAIRHALGPDVAEPDTSTVITPPDTTPDPANNDRAEDHHSRTALAKPHSSTRPRTSDHRPPPHRGGGRVDSAGERAAPGGDRERHRARHRTRVASPATSPPTIGARRTDPNRHRRLQYRTTRCGPSSPPRTFPSSAGPDKNSQTSALASTRAR